ncbi:hypothetical protein U1Q18_024439 [Sarracenia purpurea var. burkii]
MASSDEEGEIVPDYVTNYHFVDYKEEPISFSTLPLRWSEDELLNGLSTQVFLRGSADSGLQHIYKKVIEWKFELSNVFPEIYVLSKDKTWIKLQKPRKSFENTIRTILITVHCLHFMKKNPEASRNAVWNHLLKAFSSYEVEPSEKDLFDHMPLIKKAAVRDKEIAKSEYVAVLLLEVSGKRKSLHEDNRTTQKIKFIVDAADDDDKEDEEEEDDDDKLDGSLLFDSVCALCDNGGELLWSQAVMAYHGFVLKRDVRVPQVHPSHYASRSRCAGGSGCAQNLRCNRNFNVGLWVGKVDEIFVRVNYLVVQDWFMLAQPLGWEYIGPQGPVSSWYVQTVVTFTYLSQDSHWPKVPHKRSRPPPSAGLSRKKLHGVRQHGQSPLQ